MIISHKYKFIFVKTFKTAGSSLEVFLSQYCGKEDVLTTINPPVNEHQARNYKGYFNIFNEIIYNNFNVKLMKQTLSHLYHQKKFYNHMPASLIKNRISPEIWNEYYKFTIERNPWEKVVSYYYMYKKRNNLDISFDDFIALGDLPFNYPLYTDKNNILVDKIIRYENLNLELKELFDDLKIPFSSLTTKAKTNYRTKRKDYKTYYNEQTKIYIENSFKDEIDLMGYTFS